MEKIRKEKEKAERGRYQKRREERKSICTVLYLEKYSLNSS